MVYLVIFWGIEGCHFQGPFADEETATNWLADYEPNEPGRNGEAEMAAVIGPVPQCGEAREF